MSDLGLQLDQDRDQGRGRARGHRRRQKARNGRGCLAVLVALAVLAGGAYFAVNAGMGALKDRFAPPEDYPGPGTGSVLVEVQEGDAASSIGQTLVEADVVKSVEAFTDAAAKDPDSIGIQVGFYEMKKQMAAEDALAILVDPKNMVQNTVGFPEGLTVEQIVAQLAEQTDFPAKQYRKVLENPKAIGLPSYAEGNPEGYLFPATYQVPPNATPKSILTAMVTRYEQAAESLDLEAEAERLGVSPHDVMVVASLIQAEARFDKDFSKVSRVIYNRLEEPMPLQFDSTVHYAEGKDGSVGTSDEARDSDSPYNTYKVAGLPPTPIMAPGEQAIEAAINPADGPWLYFVTTNPDTGETKFAESYDEHLKNKAEFDAWCADSDTC
ncbi:MAG TPA: endolytic transglycosylase MltG [Nocardioidaceae bacterium]|nr:endolytic transglycosylase MltG [Nocardioidaceae bacterium]